MQRWMYLLLAALLVWLADAPLALAADAGWPKIGVPFSRGNGGYLSVWKLLILWLFFISWVRSTDWINRDAHAMKLRYLLWNPVATFCFFFAVLLFFLLPWFAVGIVLVTLGYFGPLIGYIVYRNGSVQPYDKVLTKKHLRRWLGETLGKVGINIGEGEVDPRDLGPQVTLVPQGGETERDNAAHLLLARQSTGWRASREMLDDALLSRATHIMLDYTAESVGVRYQVDGLWQERPVMERVDGDPILEVYKGIASLKPDDRRSRQSGTFGMEIAKDKYTCRVTSQGTQTGERAVVQIEAKKLYFKNLEELGMRAKMVEQLDEILEQTSGMIIFSGMPGGGLSTMVDVVISHADRFMRNFVTVVDTNKPERDIENLHITHFSSAAGETPATVLPKLIRTYPDVILVRDVADLETLTILCEQAGDKRLALTSVRAKEAVEALLRLMLLKIPPADFAQAVTGVLNVRLIRKLCEKCKEAYPPPPEVLKQLGLPAGRIEALYRPPTQPIDPKRPDVVCDQCEGAGYLGRTGIFELLVVTDELRQALISTPKLENLRAVARKAKHRSLQDEGVLLVAKGVTSLQELLRVLKQ